jgi:ADP-ribose pyrophosphatase YjhB (NUDIX family)
MIKNRIRPIAVAIIQRGNKIFAGGGYDESKQQQFYRLMGGGIKFRETALKALKREFREEFGTELANIKLLGIKENIFTFNGQYGHEIAYIFSADFQDEKMYEDKNYPVLDRVSAGYAQWLEYDDDLLVYPQGVEEYIKKGA